MSSTERLDSTDSEDGASIEPPAAAEVDATGLTCPLPLLKAKQALNGLNGGDCLKIVATDPGSVRDFKVFADLSGNQLLESSEREGIYTYFIRKG